MSTRIKNTVVSGSSLMSNLSTVDLQQLLLNVALDPAENVVMEPMRKKSYLSYDNWVTALTSPSGLGIDATGLTVGWTALVTGVDAADTVEYAKKLIGLFNLSSSSNPVVAKFRLAGGAAAQDVYLSFNSMTYTNVNICLNGAVAEEDYAKKLFDNIVPVGTTRRVEIYGKSFVSGNEVVTFNIGTG